MRDGTAMLAYVHGNEVAHSWHTCMIELLGWDMTHEERIINGGFCAVRCNSGALVDARNKVAAQFLDSDAEWLFWVDTDMGFAPDTVDRLIASADPVERPIVGALCFAQKEASVDGLGGFRCTATPTLYRWGELDGQEGFVVWWDYPRDELVQVAGTGSACIVIHRDVMLKIGELTDGRWYDRTVNPSNNMLFSEDLSFCGRAAAAGYPVYVDTRVKTSHLKNVWLAEADYDRQSMVNGDVAS